MTPRTVQRLEPLAVAAWIAAWALFVAAVCPAPHDGSLIGVHSFPGASDNEVQLVANAGFKWLRVPMSWRHTQPQQNSYTWDWVDQRIPQAFSRGFSIMLYLGQVPGWANGGAAANVCPLNAFSNAYGDFLTQLINHQLPDGRLVGAEVAAFEVWNEPNLPDFWVCDQTAYKNRILAPAINAIVAARQSANGFSPAWIVAPSTYVNYDKGNALDIDSWVSGYLASIDAVSVHTYGSQNTQLQEMIDANSYCAGHPNCANNAEGWWDTEAGFETVGCSQANCASNPGPALLATQNKCIVLSQCLKNFIFNLGDVPGQFDSGLLDTGYFGGGDLVRGRLCYLEANYGAPLAQVSPCPCPGNPGCDGHP